MKGLPESLQRARAEAFRSTASRIASEPTQAPGPYRANQRPGAELPAWTPPRVNPGQRRGMRAFERAGTMQREPDPEGFAPWQRSGMTALELTGLPAFRRAGQAGARGDVGGAAFETGMGALGVAGMVGMGGLALRPTVSAPARFRAGPSLADMVDGHTMPGSGNLIVGALRRQRAPMDNEAWFERPMPVRSLDPSRVRPTDGVPPDDFHVQQYMDNPDHNPIVVQRPRGLGSLFRRSDDFDVIDGHHRLEAARRRGAQVEALDASEYFGRRPMFEPSPAEAPAITPPRYGANDRGALERGMAAMNKETDFATWTRPGGINTELYPERLWNSNEPVRRMGGRSYVQGEGTQNNWNLTPEEQAHLDSMPPLERARMLSESDPNALSAYERSLLAQMDVSDRASLMMDSLPPLTPAEQAWQARVRDPATPPEEVERMWAELRRSHLPPESRARERWNIDPNDPILRGSPDPLADPATTLRGAAMRPRGPMRAQTAGNEDRRWPMFGTPESTRVPRAIQPQTRASDGSILPQATPQPIRQSLVGGSEDLLNATKQSQLMARTGDLSDTTPLAVRQRIDAFRTQDNMRQQTVDIEGWTPQQVADWRRTIETMSPEAAQRMFDVISKRGAQIRTGALFDPPRPAPVPPRGPGREAPQITPDVGFADIPRRAGFTPRTQGIGGRPNEDRRWGAFGSMSAPPMARIEPGKGYYALHAPDGGGEFHGSRAAALASAKQHGWQVAPIPRHGAPESMNTQLRQRIANQRLHDMTNAEEARIIGLDEGLDAPPPMWGVNDLAGASLRDAMHQGDGRVLREMLDGELGPFSLEGRRARAPLLGVGAPLAASALMNRKRRK